MVSLTGNSNPFVTRGSRNSHTPPHHALRGGLPAFLNLHGMVNKNYMKAYAGFKLSKIPSMTLSISLSRGRPSSCQKIVSRSTARKFRGSKSSRRAPSAAYSILKATLKLILNSNRK